MFDSYRSDNRSNQSIRINAVSGSILKNHPKSFFLRFNLNDSMGKSLLRENGHKAEKTVTHFNDYGRFSTTTENTSEKDIIILQMMMCGDLEVIAECVYRKDYEVSVLGPTVKDVLYMFGGDTKVNIFGTDMRHTKDILIFDGTVDDYFKDTPFDDVVVESMAVLDGEDILKIITSYVVK